MGKRKMRGGSQEISNISKSAYRAMGNNQWLNFIFSISFMGLIWFFISMFLVKHMYSEALCYGLMLLSIVLSLFLMITVAVVRMQGDSFMKKLLSMVMFVITKCLPGILIGIQLALLVYIMTENALYLYITPSEDRSRQLDIFNMSTAFGIIIQMFMYRTHLSRVLLNDQSPQNPAVLPGFVLIGILTSFSISQIFVILKYLKVDG